MALCQASPVCTDMMQMMARWRSKQRGKHHSPCTMATLPASTVSGWSTSVAAMQSIDETTLCEHRPGSSPVGPSSSVVRCG